MKYSAPLGVLIAVAQVAVEGARWQMWPAYALSLLFLGLRFVRRRVVVDAERRRSTLDRIATALGATLGVLVLALSVALPLLIPVFHLPKPTGPYAIGSVTHHWIDSARTEVFTDDPSDRRELMVQVWYPARDVPGARRAPYVEHPEALAPLARLFKLPGFVFSHLGYVTTNAIQSAPTTDGGPFPVIIFAHGRGGYRQHNTMQVEDLVSHGFVVAAMDEPGAATGVVFPDGRLAPFDPRMFDPIDPGHPVFLDSVIPFLAQDASFTLDRLTTMNQVDPTGILAGKLDLAHAGMFGVSLGGEVTAETCRMDPRLRACLIIDVFPPKDVLEQGLTQPTMWISRDAESMQRERWPQRDIDETQNGMRSVYSRLPGDGYLVLIPGAFHPNFSDFPLLSPLTKWAGLIGPIDPHRAHMIMDDMSLAFFERHLKGAPAPLLDNPRKEFPEVLYESRPR
jgi:predicted dienelactone hydrolase